MKPTVADEMFPEGPPYTDVEDVGETCVFPDYMVHVDFYKGCQKCIFFAEFVFNLISVFQDSMTSSTRMI